jgi:hypothetical protein
MYQHFGVTFDPPVELVVRLRGVAEGDVVRDRDGRFCLSGDDQVTKVTVVSLETFVMSSKRNRNQ